MRATARVAAAQRAHSIVLCTPTASYARLRSLHVAAASPRAMPSKGDSLARGQRAASRCGAGFYSPVDLLAEEQPGGQVCLQVEGMDEPLVVNKVCKCWQCLGSLGPARKDALAVSMKWLVLT